MAEQPIRPLYIFDLDGMLASCHHRVRFLEEVHNPNRWREFYAACDRDPPIEHTITVMNALRLVGDVLIWTGRSDEVRDKTEAWLVEHTSFMSHELEHVLTMRQAGDHRPDDVLKGEWLAALHPDRRRQLWAGAVFEDRDRMVAMYREAGFACYQVAPGGF